VDAVVVVGDRAEAAGRAAGAAEDDGGAAGRFEVAVVVAGGEGDGGGAARLDAAGRDGQRRIGQADGRGSHVDGRRRRGDALAADLGGDRVRAGEDAGEGGDIDAVA